MRLPCKFLFLITFGIILLSCHTKDPSTGGGGIDPPPPVPEILATLEEMRESNALYIKEKLGSISDDAWFSDFPMDEDSFYYIAVSWKTSLEQRARTRAQEEARSLLIKYRSALQTAQSELTFGRIIEVVEWKTITGREDDGMQYYISCAKIRVSLMKQNGGDKK